MLSSNSSIDAIAKAPEVHKILLENDRFRVLEVKIEPGKKTEMHWHPDNIVYILSPGRLKFTKEDGGIVEADLHSGQLTQSTPGSHEVENIGGTTVKAIQIESKR